MTATNLKIAWVHLSFKLKQTAVAVLGVTFGISVFVFMNSFMTGVNDIQTTLAFTSVAHIRIYNDGPVNHTNLLANVYPAGTIINISNAKVIKYTEGIKNSAAILALVKKQPEVVAATPQVNINAFFRNGGNKINGVLSGVEVENEHKLFDIAAYMVQGTWNGLAYRPDGIILGLNLARDLSVNVGDNVNILTPDGVSHNYKLIGIFQTNVESVDRSKAYINISAARQLLNKNQAYVTDVQVDVDDFETTEPLLERLTPVIPYKVESWQVADQQLAAGSKLRNIIAMSVSLAILLVAGFGIYNILNMTINEKIREIAILKAIGFSGADVTEIFLAQAIFIGIVGGVVGMVLGFVLATIVNHIPFQLAGQDHLPMAYAKKVYIMAFVFGLITTLLAGYLPARKASKIDPVEILRG
jgi:lipoprotein-releasing system permease protein